MPEKRQDECLFLRTPREQQMQIFCAQCPWIGKIEKEISIDGFCDALGIKMVNFPPLPLWILTATMVIKTGERFVTS